MKKLLFTASSIFLAATLCIGINSYKSINSMSDLLLANVEALTVDETILDLRIYYVDAIDSGHWFCRLPGTSACPSPD